MAKYYFIVFFLFVFSSFSEEFSKILEKDYWSLMGENWPQEDWNNMFISKHGKLIQKVASIYEKNKYLQLQPLNQPQIPKKVHIIWLGPKNFPIKSIENVRSWIALHPTWEFHFWTDRERLAPCPEMKIRQVKNFTFSTSEDSYRKMNNWAAKSDILRYEILFQEGGIYIDHDIFCYKKFDPLLIYDFFCGSDKMKVGHSGYQLCLHNALIGAKPAHPIFLKSLESIEKRFDLIHKKFPEENQIDIPKRILNLTYVALTIGAFDYFDTADLIETKDIVLPNLYFSQYKNVPSIYAKDLCDQTWINLYEESMIQKQIKEKLSLCDEKRSHILWMQMIALALFFPMLLLVGRK